MPCARGSNHPRRYVQFWLEPRQGQKELWILGSFWLLLDCSPTSALMCFIWLLQCLSSNEFPHSKEARSTAAHDLRPNFLAWTMLMLFRRAFIVLIMSRRCLFGDLSQFLLRGSSGGHGFAIQEEAALQKSQGSHSSKRTNWQLLVCSKFQAPQLVQTSCNHTHLIPKMEKLAVTPWTNCRCTRQKVLHACHLSALYSKL